jgi:long-chain fatty acid transport protein
MCARLSTVRFAGIVAGVLATSAHAAGFYIQEQSVQALGRAYSGEAASTGVDDLWWNPASIAGLPHNEFYSGLQTIQVHGNVTNGGSTIQYPGLPPIPISGNPRVHDPVPNGFVPNFDAAMRINDQWSVGLAVSAPFNFVSKYTGQDWTRYEAMTSRLTNIDLQPTVAWKPLPWLGLAVGFDAQYVNAYLTSALADLAPIFPDGSETLRGHGWDYGYVLGAQIAPASNFTFGASYRSSIAHHLGGTIDVAGLLGPASAANIHAGAQARFSTPWIFTAGARWRVNPRLAVEGQVQRFGWSEFSAISVDFAGQSAVTPENYRDTTDEAIGLDYNLTSRLTMRAGVEHDPTPSPDIGRDPRVPDGNRWLYALGASYKASHAMTFDFGAGYYQFQRSHIDSTTVDFAGTPLATPVSLMGEITGAGLVLSVGVRATF